MFCPASAVGLAAGASVAVDGGDILSVPVLAEAHVLGIFLPIKVEENDVARAIVGHGLRPVVGQESGTVGRFSPAVV